MKRLLTSVAALVVIGGGALAWYVTHLPQTPFADTAPDDLEAVRAQTSFADIPSMVAHGEEVAHAGDCVACHSTETGAPLAGGLAMATPMGNIYTTNITPDPEHGIGAMDLAQFDRAMRHGVAPDGARLYPAMPYPSYVKMTDDDIAALYAYLQSEITPEPTANHESDIPWPLNIRWPLALWNAVFAPSGTYQPDPAQDEAWNRGAYLVQAAGHCGSCHTPRALTMNEKAYDGSDPAYLSGALLDGWYAPSLRQDHNTGLGRWSEDEIFTFLDQGRNAHSVVFGSMAEAYNNSLQFMPETDLRAMAHYLKSLPGDPERDGTPWQAPREGTDNSAEAHPEGARVYASRCAACHGREGAGQTPWISPLAGAASSLAPVSDSQMNVVLNGSWRVVTDGVPDTYRMPPFRAQLTDAQIADVLSYVRSAWGNTGQAVKPEDVAKMRAHTDPASATPIVLQMR